MDEQETVQTWECPSSDCSYSTGGASELAEHVNSEHPGEYKRKDWLDTEAGRLARGGRESSEEETDED